jgi:colanic acid/amylovoran biosynthesis glycosyltransferase
MKVAFITGAFPLISETFVLGQITGLLDRGVDVHIFSYEQPARVVCHPDVAEYRLMERTSYLPARLKSRGLRRLHGALAGSRFCVRMPGLLKSIRSWETLRGLLDTPSCSLAERLRQEGGFDVVHAQFGLLGIKAARLKAAGVLRGPLVTSFRGGDTTIALLRNPRVYHHLFHWGDLFLPVSRFLRSRLLACGCPADRIVVQHSGVNLGEFPFQQRGLPPRGAISLLCIARLVEVKGVQYAIEALSLLRQRGFDVRLTVLGDGPLRAECEGLASFLGIGDRVVLQGDCSRARVRHFLEQSHIFVCPSIIGSNGAQEGMPNAVKEAMACGLPVVATDTGGIGEVVRDGVTGHLVPQKDPGAIADAVERLVRSPESWTVMCRNARRMIEEQFDNRRLNDRLVHLYRNLAAKALAGRAELWEDEAHRDLDMEMNP